mmetsp:Transcript_56545/g.89801  ORF Transcript_56545/g.89801 Transcript_56545/m.89801 type:complete len:392 (+) Transcript_56545:67-1242(+)|eukprot:CAMPEP_0169096688 /NCGR_PEP_ID=MMETSP1015-20121227/19128_1 /TAXON_ID=342587 /ORGANISM="Karlodinium micrum, Strain CCMP2283" /LENGTH=391 /DNA_ID=CAMNT_0009157461 /DNA_START=67 /DNA_END=1242 /DNA_ORIENTATION=-
MSGARPLRIGILGAARGAPMIVIKPIKRNPDLAAKIELVAVAARDAARASAFAKEWGIPRSYGSYAELLADPEIDAVYISLPNMLHCEWTVKTLQAGKHVLCGKPLSSNAREAVVMQRAAEDAGKVCLEAFHAIRHPIFKQVRELVTEGKVGSVRHVSVKYMVNLASYDQRVRSQMHTPTPVAQDYRMRSECAGGVTMDLGCYCVAIIRAVTGEEPRVVKATAQRWRDDQDIDAAMVCFMELPSGATAEFECSFVAKEYSQPIQLKIAGTGGDLRAEGLFSSHKANRIVLEQWDDSGIVSSESVDDPNPASTHDSFYYQLLAFVDEVREQEKRSDECQGLPWAYKSIGNAPSDSVRNMAVIDDIYRAAGMKPRSTLFAPPAPYNSIGSSKL